MANGQYEIDDDVYKNLSPRTVDLMVFRTFNAYRVEDRKWKKGVEASLRELSEECHKRNSKRDIKDNIWSLVGGIIGGALMWIGLIKLIG